MFRQLASCTLVGCCVSLLGCGGKTADAGKDPPIAMTVREKNTAKTPSVGPVGKLQGIVKSVDPDKRSLTVTVRGQDQTYPVDPSAFILTETKTNIPVPGGLGGLRPGYDVSFVTTRSGGQETISLITVHTQIFKFVPDANE